VRTKLGYVLIGIGAFLIIVAILAQTYAPAQLKKTPIDADSVTNLSGTAILNGLDGFQQFPVLAVSTTKADSEKSDGDVVLFQYSSCVVRDEGGIDGCVSSDDPEDRLLTAGTDTFAADRKTGLAVNDDKYLPEGAEPHEGLLNKWPFDAQKKTYPYWEGTTGEAVPATFVRTDEIDGTEVYVYSVEVKDAPIQLSEDVSGLYSDSEEISIEPRTGAFVNVERKVSRTTTDGTPVLNLKLEYTDAEVKDSLDTAVDSANKLHLLTSTIPLIGYIGGGLCLLAGIVLLLMRRSEDEGRRTMPANRKQDSPVGV
jgi:hypothetical protein